MINSGVCCFSKFSPSSPFAAVNTLYSSERISFNIHNSSLLSSITKIVAEVEEDLLSSERVIGCFDFFNE